MWSFKRAWPALLALSSAAGAAGFGAAPSTSLYDEGMRNSALASQRQRIRLQDPEELRAAIDETQGLFGALAYETGKQPREALLPLLKELREDYKLPAAEKRARRAVELSEEVDAIQAGIKQQQQRVKEAPADAADREEERLLGLQSDLLNSVEELRKTLRSLHKDLDEAGLRDLRNWAMVGEGLLRRRREAAEEEAARQQAAEALPITADPGDPAMNPTTATPAVGAIHESPPSPAPASR